jgi:YesN/AraC family two-component response regulator
LEAVAKHDYSLVVTDLQMPNLSGLPFIRKLHHSFPGLPFVVFTGFGEMDDAIEALRLGALNFLRKPWDLNQIVPSVERALHLVERTARRRKALSYIDSLSESISLPPQISAKEAVIQHLVDPLHPMGVVSEAEVRNVFLALDEVLNNAIVYGALGIDSRIREKESNQREFEEAVVERENDPAYQNRMVRIEADYTREEVSFRIRDPGQGFDHRNLPDPTDPENLMKEHGRGLLLVRCFVDEVEFNDKGNEVTLVKRRAPRTEKTNGS